MSYIGTVYIVMAYIVMAYLGMAYIVMACISGIWHRVDEETELRHLVYSDGLYSVGHSYIGQ